MSLEHLPIETRIEALERQAHLNDFYEKECRKSGAEYQADQQKGAAQMKRAEAARLRKQLAEREE